MKDFDLDTLFKDKLQNREVPFDPEAWDRAKASLDRHKKRRPIGYRKVAASFAVLVALSVVLYFAVNGIDERTELAENNIETTAADNNNAGQDTQSGSNSETEGSVAQPNDASKTTADNGETAAANGGNNNNVANDDENSGASDSRSYQSASAGQTYREAKRQNSRTRPNNAIDQNTSDDKTARNKENPIGPMNPLLGGYNLPAQTHDLEIDPKEIQVHDIPELKPVIKHRISILGGVSASRGVTGGARTGDYFADPMFGIGYEYLISPSFSVEANAIYRQRSNSGTFHEYEDSYYGLGRTDFTMTFENEIARYIEIPVFVNFSPAFKHKIQAGASISYLAGSSDDLEIISESPFTESPSTVLPEYEDYSVLRSFDVGVQLGYEYEIIPNLNLGSRFYYGMNNISTDNDVFETQNARNMFLSGYLKYNLRNL